MRFRCTSFLSGFLSGIILAVLMLGCGASQPAPAPAPTPAPPSPAPPPVPTPPPAPTPPPNPGPPSADITSVNHVVIMLQENRSFDHYFGQMTTYRTANNIPIVGSPATIDDESAGSYSNSGIAAYHTGSVCTEDLTPAWTETHKNFDWENPAGASSSAPMDGFVNLAVQVSQYAATMGITMVDQTGRRVMGYFDGNDLNYYYFMASNFAIDDRFFAPVPSYSPAQRAYLFAATSQGYVHDPGAGKLTAKTIWQELDAAGISWKIYSEEQNLYTYLQEFAYYNQPGVSAKVVSINQFFTDAAAGQLPAVSYIETGLYDGLSEHTSNFDPANPQQGEVPINVQTGAQYASKVINAVVQGPSWTDSVIFFAHDEGGGFFDHVPPMAVPSPDGIKPVDLTSSDVPGDFTITASRVPNMVISPFAKKNFVSHTPMDYTAYLRFIETRWNLPTLTARDAAMPDMTEFFDFTNKPWATPPSPPAQNTSGVCDFTKQ